MAKASRHDEEVKQLMVAEADIVGRNDFQLEGVDHSADGVKQSSGQKPEESGGRKVGINRGQDGNAEPAHSDVHHGRDQFRTGHPEEFEQHSQCGHNPNRDEEPGSGLSRNGNQAYRGIGAGNQYEDAHVVQAFQAMVPNFIQIKCVIGCAGTVQQNHAQHENPHGNQRPKRCTAEGPVNQKERGRDDGHQESDKMSQRTDGIFGAEYRAILRCLGTAGNGIGGIR